jgi:hypothetical protein
LTKQMKKNFVIKKYSGEMESFSRKKLMNSLMRSGADSELVGSIADDVESWMYDGMSSKMIYDRAFALLRKKQLGIAARYKLKKAMMELGPTGYPFEILVGEVYRLMGFNVEVGQVLQGNCVTHEVDVIATKGREQYFIECKYYQKTGKNANVQVPMYIRSRVDDLIKYRKSLPEYSGYDFHGGVVTNTRFTTDAISFGECTGLHLMSWDYPEGNGLKEFIDREHIFPITVLTKLLLAEKQALMENDIVICSQLLKKPNALEAIGLDVNRQKKVMEEVRFLCPEKPL